jgi:hypothetical protein
MVYKNILSVYGIRIRIVYFFKSIRKSNSNQQIIQFYIIIINHINGKYLKVVIILKFQYYNLTLPYQRYCEVKENLPSV